MSNKTLVRILKAGHKLVNHYNNWLHDSVILSMNDNLNIVFYDRLFENSNTNLSSSLSINTGIQTSDKADLCVDTKEAINILSVIDSMELNIIETDKLAFDKNGLHKINCINDSENFDVCPDGDLLFEYSCNSEFLLDVLNNIVAKKTNLNNPLKNALLEIEFSDITDNALYLVTTDGFRVQRRYLGIASANSYQKNRGEDKVKFTLTWNIIASLKDMLKIYKKSEIKIAFYKNAILISGERFVYKTLNIDFKYFPSYESVMPKDYQIATKTVFYSPDDLVKKINAFSYVWKNSFHNKLQIRFDYENELPVIDFLVYNEENDIYRQVFRLTKNDFAMDDSGMLFGEDKIFINAQYLVDALKSKCNRMVIQKQDNSNYGLVYKPIIFKDSNFNIELIQMPINDRQTH